MFVSVDPGPAFGELLRSRRRALNIGLQELSEACGVNLSSLSQIENGHKRPPEIYPFVVSLAQRLRLEQNSPDYSQFLTRAVRERFKDLKVDLDSILKTQNEPQGAPVSPEELSLLTGRASLFYPRPYLPYDILNPFRRLPILAQFYLSNVMSIISLGFAKTLTVGLVDGRSVTYDVGFGPFASQPPPETPSEGERS